MPFLPLQCFSSFVCLAKEKTLLFILQNPAYYHQPDSMKLFHLCIPLDLEHRRSPFRPTNMAEPLTVMSVGAIVDHDP